MATPTTDPGGPAEGEPLASTSADRKPSPLKRALGGKFVRDTVLLQGGMFLTMGTYLFTSVLLARGLGAHEFGRYTEVITLFTVIFFLANLGVTTATVSLYSKACGQGDEQAKTHALASFVKAFSLMLIGIAGFGLVLPAFSEWFYDDREVGTCALYLCMSGPMLMVHAFVLVILQGARRMREYVLYTGACDVIRLFLLLLAILGCLPLTGVVLAYLSAGVINGLIGLRIYYLSRHTADDAARPPAVAAVIAAIPKVRLRTFLGQSTSLALNKNGSELTRNFIILFVGRFAGEAELARFRVASTFIWAIQQLLGGVGRNVLPSIGHRHGRAGADVRGFKRDVRRVMWVTGGLFIALTAAFVIVAPFAIKILYGHEYMEATTFIYVFAIGHLSIGFAVVNEAFYIFTHRIRHLLAINLSIYALAIPTGYLLCREFGAIGGAATIAGAQILNFTHLFVIARYVYGSKDERPPARPADLGGATASSNSP